MSDGRTNPEVDLDDPIEVDFDDGEISTQEAMDEDGVALDALAVELPDDMAQMAASTPPPAPEPDADLSIEIEHMDGGELLADDAQDPVPLVDTLPEPASAGPADTSDSLDLDDLLDEIDSAVAPKKSAKEEVETVADVTAGEEITPAFEAVDALENEVDEDDMQLNALQVEPEAMDLEPSDASAPPDRAPFDLASDAEDSGAEDVVVATEAQHDEPDAAEAVDVAPAEAMPEFDETAPEVSLDLEMESVEETPQPSLPELSLDDDGDPDAIDLEPPAEMPELEPEPLVTPELEAAPEPADEPPLALDLDAPDEPFATDDQETVSVAALSAEPEEIALEPLGSEDTLDALPEITPEPEEALGASSESAPEIPEPWAEPEPEPRRSAAAEALATNPEALGTLRKLAGEQTPQEAVQAVREALEDGANFNALHLPDGRILMVALIKTLSKQYRLDLEAYLSELERQLQ